MWLNLVLKEKFSKSDLKKKITKILIDINKNSIVYEDIIFDLCRLKRRKYGISYDFRNFIKKGVG